MSTTIKLKNSQTSGGTPSSLVQGELGLNEADGILYYRDAATGDPVALIWSGGTFTGNVGLNGNTSPSVPLDFGTTTVSSGTSTNADIASSIRLWKSADNANDIYGFGISLNRLNVCAAGQIEFYAGLTPASVCRFANDAHPQILVTNGNSVVSSVNYPGYSFNGDEDTGVGSLAANVLSFITSGEENVRITPDGRLVIGNFLSSAISNNYAATTSALTVSTAKDASWGNVHIHDNQSATAGVGGQIILSGCYNGLSGAARYGIITAAKENSTQGDYRGYFNIQVNNGAGPQERLRIDSNGNVGINTSPDYMLDVAGTGNFDSTLFVSGATYEYENQPGISVDGSLYLSGNQSGVINNSENGLYWHPSSSYAIHRKAGAWNTPNYQQLYVTFATGIVINGGDKLYGLAHTDIRGTASLGGNFRTLVSSDTNTIARYGLTVYPYNTDDGTHALNVDRTILNLTTCRANTVQDMPENETGALMLRFYWPTGMRIRWRIRGSNFRGNDLCYSVDYQTYKALAWTGADDSCYANGKVPFDRIRILQDDNSATSGLYYLCLGDTTTVWNSDMVTVDVDIGWSGASSSNVNRWSDLYWFAATSLSAYSTAFSHDAKVEPGRLYSRMVTGYNNDNDNVDIGWHGDRDTGFSRPNADTITAVTGGEERLRIFPDGGVALGNSSPFYSLNSCFKIGNNRDFAGAQAFLLDFGATVENVGGSARGMMFRPKLGGTSLPTEFYGVEVAPLYDLSLPSSQKHNVYYGFKSKPIGSRCNQCYQFLAEDVVTTSFNIGFYSRLGSSSAYHFYGQGDAKAWFQGNVGIGASRTSPASALDVNGDITITDKIVHSGDTNTFISFPAADTFAIETDGEERLRVNSSGRVGINSQPNAAQQVRIVSGLTAANSTALTVVASNAGTFGIYTSGAAPNYLGFLRVVSGSSTSPSISGLADTNTGLFLTGSDAVGLTANATQRLLCDSSGTTVSGGFNVEGPITEGYVNNGNSGTAQTIALTSGTIQNYTLTGNCTFTMPTASAGQSFTVFLRTGAGSFTGAFTGVKWPDNSPPTITPAANKMDIISFVSDGTNWYGSIQQGYAP